MTLVLGFGRVTTFRRRGRKKFLTLNRNNNFQLPLFILRNSFDHLLSPLMLILLRCRRFLDHPRLAVRPTGFRRDRPIVVGVVPRKVLIVRFILLLIFFVRWVASHHKMHVIAVELRLRGWWLHLLIILTAFGSFPALCTE